MIPLGESLVTAKAGKPRASGDDPAFCYDHSALAW